MAAARTTARNKATAYLPTLASHIFRATPNPSWDVKDTYRDLLALPPRPDWDSPSGKTLLHRLVLALPWPEACVDDPAATHARLLGRLMDLTTVRNSRLHPIANSWVAWGSKALLQTCSVWADAVECGVRLSPRLVQLPLPVFSYHFSPLPLPSPLLPSGSPQAH